MLNRDFREFIKSLNDNGVRYLVIGGYAVALHGHPRYTKDLDLWVEPDGNNAKRLLQSLEQFGFGSLGLSEQDFSDPDQVIQLGYPPNRIDLIFSASGVDFKTCFESRQIVLIDNIEIKFIDLENLRKNKRSTGRLQDLADLENLA